jgi:hypothetical protein
MMTNPAPQRMPRGNLRRLNGDKIRLVAAQSEWKAREVLMTSKDALIRKRLCRSHFLARWRQVICPTGSGREFLSSPRAKNKSLLFFRNMWFLPAHPTP